MSNFMIPSTFQYPMVNTATIGTMGAMESVPPNMPSLPEEPTEDMEEPKTKANQRSRSGCFTCRVRRKKCDEEKPTCKSCSKLSLKCDYKPPKWWASVEQRRQQKERIKERIRQSKIIEKEGNLKEYMKQIHALAKKPAVTQEFDFNRPVAVVQPSQMTPSLPTPVTPQDMSAKPPQQAIFNNTPYLQGSPIPNFGFMSQPQLQTPTQTPELPNNDWLQNSATFPQPYSPIDATGFLNPNRPLSTSLHSLISLEENDRPLLDHFVDHVIRLVFPILEIHRGGAARINEILGSLQVNRSYLHCCLSAAAIHLKWSKDLEDQMDHDIMSHRYAAISQLCRILNRGSGQMQVMDATLAMIFYHCSIGTMEDYLPDIPWNSHFQAVTNLVKKLQCPPTQLNISLISWIDILGSTMLGETPQFSHTYRTKHLSGTSSGLQQLMGCEDRIMYLISEIACLESLKIEGRVDDVNIYSHISALNAQIDWTEPTTLTFEMPYGPSGMVNPEQLTKTISALFRIASRIYLFSIIPGFNPSDPSIVNLVASLVDVLQYIPTGPTGFDRSIVWPLFIAGVYSIPSSNFRTVLEERTSALGYLGNFGNFGRMYRLLKEVWRASDEASLNTPVSGAMYSQGGGFPIGFEGTGQQLQQPTRPQIHWRDVMRRNKWDYLLM
ncbi:sexual development transcription factor rosa [Aspergillus ambiguus]|uniref:Zn(II)2Cys6 transcription factor n=1 Tax=Aspergillus ambiguus TaxID=176160 RepID=UPI003CCD368D